MRPNKCFNFPIMIFCFIGCLLMSLIFFLGSFSLKMMCNNERALDYQPISILKTNKISKMNKYRWICNMLKPSATTSDISWEGFENNVLKIWCERSERTSEGVRTFCPIAHLIITLPKWASFRNQKENQ